MNRVVKAACRFAGEKSGNVGIIFAVLAIPLTLVTGVAVDFGRAQAVSTRLQNATDSAAMAAATAGALSESEKIATATKIFNANAASVVSQYGVAPNVTVGPSFITVTANVDVPTTFMRIAGLLSTAVGNTETIPVAVQSHVQTAGKTLEIAMMLDVTGSMGGQKIEDLKWATKDMMDIVMPVGGANSQTRMALVPFANKLNAGSYASAATGLAATRLVGGHRRCVRRRWIRGRRRCVEWRTVGGTTKKLIKCVTERQGSYRYDDDEPASGRYLGWANPGSSTDSQYSNSGKCYSNGGTELPEIKPLSYDRDMLRTHIDSFQAGGGTAGHLGTSWAWYMLAPKWNALWPTESQSLAYDEETNIKAAVIMTDGQYNTDYTSGLSSTTMARATCEEMKAKGIIVYTVGFAIANPSTARTTLIQCATSSDHYFFPYNGEELRAVFRSIGQALSYAQGSARIAN